jgi:hypothetical protein
VNFFLKKDPAQSSKYFYYLFSDRWRWWRRFRCVAREELRRPTRWYRTLTGLSEEKRKEWNFFWLRCKTKRWGRSHQFIGNFQKGRCTWRNSPRDHRHFPCLI